jgi:hypothetical protein
VYATELTKTEFLENIKRGGGEVGVNSEYFGGGKETDSIVFTT